MADMAYQVFLRVGADLPVGPPGTTNVDLTPQELTVDAAVEAIRASGLTAADLRTKALFVASPGSRDASILAYSAVCGFAGRRIDFTDLQSGVVDARSLHDAAAAAGDTGKPDDPELMVQVGKQYGDASVLSLTSLDQVLPEMVTAVRFARQCRLALGDRGTAESLTLLVACAGLRHRLGGDRFPLLVAGDEPPPSTDDEVLFAPGVDLDAIRRGAAELRRSLRVDDRSFLAESVPPTDRQVALSEAASADPAEVLSRLGSYFNEETGFWRCPRPERHRNGDANPSTRVTDGLVRCFRCDSEPVDSLRLVMDCLGLAPDDAATWLSAV